MVQKTTAPDINNAFERYCRYQDDDTFKMVRIAATIKGKIIEIKKKNTSVNTHEGWLAFGVSQRGEDFEITGVEKPDKVQNDFLSVLHTDKKVSHDVQLTEKMLDIGGKTIFLFHIAKNPRMRKPVYLVGDIRRTFL